MSHADNDDAYQEEDTAQIKQENMDTKERMNSEENTEEPN
jgi:hypothetical protein